MSVNWKVVQPNDPPHLKAAFSRLGISEVDDAHLVLAMFAAAGHPEIKNASTTPWCAAFVRWCLIQAGIDARGSLMARSLATFGRGLPRNELIPRGAIAIWPRGAPPSGHTDFVLHDDGTYVTCIDGNVGDHVTITHRRKSEALCYRMPPIVVVPDAEPVPLPRPKPQEQDTEEPDPQPAPVEPRDDDARLPWWHPKRAWRWATGGGIGLGGFAVDPAGMAKLLFVLISGALLLVLIALAVACMLFTPKAVAGYIRTWLPRKDA